MKKYSELATRTLTGSIYVGIVLCSILFSSVSAALLFWIIGILGLKEFYDNIKRTNGIAPLHWYGYVLGTAVYLVCGNLLPSSYIPQGELAVMILFGLLFMIELFRKKKHPFLNIATTFLGTAYVFFLLSLTFRCSFVGNSYSPTLLLSIFIFVWSNDTFAYLTGSVLGKHKLFPRISPGKSWEGFAGGIILTMGIASIYACLSSQNLLGCDILLPWQWFVMAMVVCVIGTFGDLIESLFKRSLHIKDSSNILPGHGGILDRFDSILFAGPASYIVLQVFSYL